MDNKRSGIPAPASRTSALPRPTSRLPQPRSAIPAPASSPAPKQPSVQGATTRNPRLRPAASRDSLSGSRTGSRASNPPVSYGVATTRNSERQIRRASSQEWQPTISDTSQAVQDTHIARAGVLRRKPSAQWISAAHTDLNAPEEHSADSAAIASPSEEAVPDNLWATPRKPRPSLSDRTIETLSQLPSSPAIKRRGSNFFNANEGNAQAQRPQSRGTGWGSRPSSSHQSETQNSFSRPGSSSEASNGPQTNFKASTASYGGSLATVQGTPSKRTSATIKSLRTPSAKSSGVPQTPKSGLNKVPSRASLSASIGPRTPSPVKQSELSVSKNGPRSMTTRGLNPRAPVSGLFKKPSLGSLDQPNAASSDLPVHPRRKVSQASGRSSATSGGRNLSSPSNASTAVTTEPSDSPPEATARKSSAALREQIAKAKAAKRRHVSSSAPVPEAQETSVVPTDDGFDFGLSEDPFGQNRLQDSSKKVMQSRVSHARSTGRLNIAAMGLKEIPEEVLKMYDLESIGGGGGAWAESVDLTRFVAADNELEMIDDSVFPDRDPSDFADEEDSQGYQFGGLEALDLHGNQLVALPMGLRRLQYLSSLNLTHNRLTNNCLEVISQVSTLRDLKLGDNLLEGHLDDDFANLTNLEILDLHGNKISGLPTRLGEMSRLRILNLAENAFESLPFEDFSRLPLTELVARKNKLSGTLIGYGVEKLSLQTLDVSLNQLTQLVQPDQRFAVPSLHQLLVSANRLKSLPDMTGWDALLTLNVEENSVAEFPPGFTTLENLRHADFTSNDIRVIPPEIARMDSLALLRISGNPLRDRKFTSLNTEELKDALASRLAPLPAHEAGGIENFANGVMRYGKSGPSVVNPVAMDSTATEEDVDDSRSEFDDFATPPTSAPQSPARTRSSTVNNQLWPVKPGGILDRSNTESRLLHPDTCKTVAAAHAVREVRLQNNAFTQIPVSLSYFTSTITHLCISQNRLAGGDYMDTEMLTLPALKELVISSNSITSLVPLTQHLQAPSLEKLIVSVNRIDSFPKLRDFFPSLTILDVSNNRLTELDPDVVEGMKIITANNNEIAHLNPRLGLLGGAGGLERLEVNGNRFRVPRWDVLDRGTAATLRWLRDRVPAAEMAEWKAKMGIADDEDDGFD